MALLQTQDCSQFSSPNDLNSYKDIMAALSLSGLLIAFLLLPMASIALDHEKSILTLRKNSFDHRI